mmetsp:Transcript_18870/g.46317  ORF Transcript_18870/g.46317 Transcript_18870/m.46317 type:complete len:470 (-) Transcript_18870:108-1517(-)
MWRRCLAAVERAASLRPGGVRGLLPQWTGGGVVGLGQRGLSTAVVENRGLLGTILSIPKRYPFQFACIFTGLKTFSADIFVQTCMEDAKEIDWRRSSVFAVFGFCYQGAFQYMVYIHIVAKRLLPNAAKYAALPMRDKLKDFKGFLQLLAQVGIANLIMDPCFCLPTYYITKEAILGKREDGQTFPEMVRLALNKYKKNAFEDITTSWKIWIPAQLVNFGLMPLHLRVPFISIISFGYCVVLSVMRGAKDKPIQEAANFQVSLTPEQHHLLANDVGNAIKKYGDQNGHLPREAFEYIFGRLGIRDRRAMQRLHEIFDLDKDGLVSPEEFAVVIHAISGSGTPAERVSSIFRVIDIDDNGLLTTDELETMLRAILRIEYNLLEEPSKTKSGLLVAIEEKTETGPAKPQSKELSQRAHMLALTVMNEAKHESPESITPEEFKAWAERGSITSEQVLRLFRAFEPNTQAHSN